MVSNVRISWPSFLLGALAAAAVFCGSAVWMVHRGFSAREKPGVMEATLAAYALHMAPAGPAANRANPIASSPAALQEAMAHFADHCASCHANNGSGHTMYGDGLNPPPPDMRLSATQNKPDGELYSIIKNGIRMSGMPAFGEPGDNDEATWKLVLFIRHLPSLTAEEEQAMRSENPITPSELLEQKEEDQFLDGQATPGKLTKGHHP